MKGMKLHGEPLETLVPEGCFETINVLQAQVPMIISVWDDEYISSSCKTSDYQREHFEILKGYQRNDTEKDMRSLE
jgi:hypothetical protein